MSELATLDIGVTGWCVVGGIFGSIFVLTCIISSVKAVRDRKRLKAKIAAKRRAEHLAREINKNKKNTTENGIEEVQTTSTTAAATSFSNNEQKYAVYTIEEHEPSDSVVKVNGTAEHEENERHSAPVGFDNLTFIDSDPRDENSDRFENIPLHEKSKDAFDSTKKHIAATRSRSGDEGRMLRHLSPECLAVQKQLRRHSYEVAVGQYSWLPKEAPTFAPSNSITSTYNFGKIAPKDGFENRGFSTEDNAKR